MKVSESSVLLIGALMIISLTSSSVQAYTFYVGGRDGWVVNPSESYSQWAERSRFQVNDTLVFKYKKGDDSVLVVKKEDYDACNISNPIEKMDGGDSTFQFDRSGPFYFISGVLSKCSQGQKVVIVVLAVRNKPPSPVTSPPPPAIQTPTMSPAASPSTSPSGSPATTSPVSSPSKAPATSPSSSPSVSPVTTSPASSPSSFSPAPTPETTPQTPSPSPASFATPPSPSPAAISPVQAAPAISPVSAPSSTSTGTPISPAPGHGSSGSVVLSSSRVALGAVAVILASAILN